MRNTLINLAFAAAFVLMAACRPTSLPHELTIGDSLPSFTLAMDDGTVLDSRELSTGTALLCFFHTMCVDCQAELPQVQRIHERYHEHVRVVAISRGQKAGPIREYWREHGLTIPFSAQEDRYVFELFAQHTIPRCYLVRDGVIVGEWDAENILTEEEFKNLSN